MRTTDPKAAEALRERIYGLSDHELLRIVYVDCDQYREEALDYARGELYRRRLSLVPLFNRNLHQTIITKEAGMSWQALGSHLSIIILAVGFIYDKGTLWVSGSLLTFFYRHYAAFKRRKSFLEAYAVLEDRLDESPVLYLRSFSDDSKTAKLIGKSTESEQLAMIFDDIGPFITIGAPDEELAELGAAPIYVSNDQWQQRVIELIAKAQLVILRIAMSPSLLWEVKTALVGIEPERLILLVPRDKRLYEAFRQHTRQMFQYPLPEYAMNKGRLLLIEQVLKMMQFWDLVGFIESMTLQGLIYFEPNGTPHFAKFGMELFRGTIEAPEVPKILKALQPVLNQLGIDCNVPRVRLSNIILVCFAILIWLLIPGFFIFLLLVSIIRLNAQF